MLAVDAERVDSLFNEWSDRGCLPREGIFVRPFARLHGEVMSENQAIDHLCRLLTDPENSPYNQQLADIAAKQIVLAAWHALTAGNPVTTLRVVPDFLYRPVFDEDGEDVFANEPLRLNYFGGAGLDGALVIATGTTAWMLLYNGMS
jgi:hypothetical protein